MSILLICLNYLSNMLEIPCYLSNKFLLLEPSLTHDTAHKSMALNQMKYGFIRDVSARHKLAGWHATLAKKCPRSDTRMTAACMSC